jgi:hypothetical protein
MKFIDNFPLPLLIGVALFMLGAPFVPEPHLVEKARMLTAGTLTRPIDIFDVFWHLAPSVLLAIRLVRMKRSRPSA